MKLKSESEQTSCPQNLKLKSQFSRRIKNLNSKAKRQQLTHPKFAIEFQNFNWGLLVLKINLKISRNPLELQQDQKLSMLTLTENILTVLLKYLVLYLFTKTASPVEAFGM